MGGGDGAEHETPEARRRAEASPRRRSRDDPRAEYADLVQRRKEAAGDSRTTKRSAASGPASGSTGAGVTTHTVLTFRDLDAPIKRTLVRVHPDALRTHGEEYEKTNQRAMQDLMQLVGRLRDWSQVELDSSSRTARVACELLPQLHEFTLFVAAGGGGGHVASDSSTGDAASATAASATASVSTWTRSDSRKGASGVEWSFRRELVPGGDVARVYLRVVLPAGLLHETTKALQKGEAPRNQPRWLEASTDVVTGLVHATHRDSSMELMLDAELAAVVERQRAAASGSGGPRKWVKEGLGGSSSSSSSFLSGRDSLLRNVAAESPLVQGKVFAYPEAALDQASVFSPRQINATVTGLLRGPHRIVHADRALVSDAQAREAESRLARAFLAHFDALHGYSPLWAAMTIQVGVAFLAVPATLTLHVPWNLDPRDLAHWVRDQWPAFVRVAHEGLEARKRVHARSERDAAFAAEAARVERVRARRRAQDAGEGGEGGGSRMAEHARGGGGSRSSWFPGSESPASAFVRRQTATTSGAPGPVDASRDVREELEDARVWDPVEDLKQRIALAKQGPDRA